CTRRNWPGVNEPYAVAMRSTWRGSLALRSSAALASLIELLDLFLILLDNDLAFDFQRRRQLAALGGKIGRRDDKFFDGFVWCQLLIEVRHTCLEQLLDLWLCC